MKLIADSGSTKTDWVLTDGNAAIGRYHTQGINPCHQAENDILAILRGELLPQLGAHTPSVVQFYGSGVRPELETVMARILKEAFPSATAIEAHSDLLGTARALCGSTEGIACILGTGANSCLYDGRAIVKNTPSLGYILGDEGSGAVLGIKFLNALYKGFLPDLVVSDFQKDMGLSVADVVARVYRQPMPNRFLASLSPFIKSHIAVPEVCELVIDNFRAFFRRNIAPYNRPDLPVNFVGSMSYHYADQLLEAATAEGFSVGQILKSPIDGLM